MRNLLVALALFLASPASAGEQVKVNLGVALQSAVALNGTQAARTFTAVDVSGFELIKIDYEITRVAGTDVKIYCEESESSQTSGFRLVLWANSSGVLQVSAAGAAEPLYSISDISSVSPTVKFSVRVGVAGYKWFRCYPTVASAGATDLVTSYATLFR